MCLELYQRWQSCSCWGFLGPQTCPELFKNCLGPRGEQDKKIVKWNEGMCTECWDRFVEEAREMAEQTNPRPVMPASSASASASSPSQNQQTLSAQYSTLPNLYSPSTQHTPSTQYSPLTQYTPLTQTSASSAKKSTAKRSSAKRKRQ